MKNHHGLNFHFFFFFPIFFSQESSGPLSSALSPPAAPLLPLAQPASSSWFARIFLFSLFLPGTLYSGGPLRARLLFSCAVRLVTPSSSVLRDFAVMDYTSRRFLKRSFSLIQSLEFTGHPRFLHFAQFRASPQESFRGLPLILAIPPFIISNSLPPTVRRLSCFRLFAVFLSQVDGCHDSYFFLHSFLFSSGIHSGLCGTPPRLFFFLLQVIPNFFFE